MFGSETLEVAIGLVVLFSFLSLFATSVRESIEAWRKDRSRLMHNAMAQLFSPNGDESDPTLARFYNSIVISPLFRGAYDGTKGNLPSYITPSDFAAAILEIAREDAKAAIGAPIGDWIDKLQGTRVSQIVRLAFTAAGKSPDATRLFLENWFNGQMERVSGWYKRSTHLILLIIGFLSAAIVNVDAIAVTQHLYRNDALREVIVAHAQSATRTDAGTKITALGGPPTSTHNERQILGDLRDYGFPIGWSWQESWPVPVPQCALQGANASPNSPSCGLNTMSLNSLFWMVLGWFITALGVSLGAPFWFDLLNKIMVIRSTVKPDEKSPAEASKDA